MKLFLDGIFFSYAQIFFSNRRWFGAAILAASLLSPEIGLMGLFGAAFSNGIAYALKFDKEKIRNGFYGFNGILLGAASTYFFALNLQLLLLIPIFIIITFFLTAVLEHYFATAFNLPGLSLPFILSLYVFLIFLGNYSTINASTHFLIDKTFFSFLPDEVSLFFKSIALIILQPSISAGIVILIAIFFFSRVHFVFMLISFASAKLFLWLLLPGLESSLSMIIAFNSLLTAIALGGSLIILSKKSIYLILLSSLMVVVFSGFFHRIFLDSSLPILVLPFNLIVLTTIYSLKFRQEQSDLVLLYFAPGSPEENFYYHQTKRKRFENFKGVFAELPFFGEWFIPQGFDGEITHKDEWKYAWDFVVTDKKNSQFSGEGLETSDYFCFNLPIIAPLDGEVVKVIDTIENNLISEVNLDQNWGNTIVLAHEYGLFSALSHLEVNSTKVKVGDSIKKGELLATCGNSGRSPYPHLHFQFQLSDKIGDKTYKFPLSSFISNSSSGYVLKTFDYPDENESVHNVEIDETVKNSFTFTLGDIVKWKCSLGKKDFFEVWEIKADIYNNMFIQSSTGDSAFLYQTEKVFYITNYTGTKKSALYYFYLSAYQVPLCFKDNLFWSDEFAVPSVYGLPLRMASELILSFRNYLSAPSGFTFHTDEENDHIKQILSDISLRGKGPFSFYKKDLSGIISFSDKKRFEQIVYSINNKKVFSATLDS